MGDIRNGSADSNTQSGPNKEPKFDEASDRFHLDAQLYCSKYAEELLQMCKAIKKYGGTYDVANEKTRLRFLLNWSLKPEKAAKMFSQYQKWRASYLPLGYIPASEVSSLLATEMIALPGKCKNGCPVLVAFGCKLEVNKYDSEAIKRFLVYIMDKTAAGGALVGKVNVIADLSNVGLKNINLKFLLLALQLQQKYYPGFLGKLFMVNVPQGFIGAYNVLSPLLPKSTKEKVVILDGRKMTEELLSEIDAEVLPKIYGGRGEIVLLQDVKVPNYGRSE